EEGRYILKFYRKKGERATQVAENIFDGHNAVFKRNLRFQSGNFDTIELLLGWEVLTHPPYSRALAPSEYHLFRPLQNFLVYLQQAGTALGLNKYSRNLSKCWTRKFKQDSISQNGFRDSENDSINVYTFDEAAKGLNTVCNVCLYIQITLEIETKPIALQRRWYRSKPNEKDVTSGNNDDDKNTNKRNGITSVYGDSGWHELLFERDETCTVLAAMLCYTKCANTTVLNCTLDSSCRVYIPSQTRDKSPMHRLRESHQGKPIFSVDSPVKIEQPPSRRSVHTTDAIACSFHDLVLQNREKRNSMWMVLRVPRKYTQRHVIDTSPFRDIVLNTRWRKHVLVIINGVDNLEIACPLKNENRERESRMTFGELAGTYGGWEQRSDRAGEKRQEEEEEEEEEEDQTPMGFTNVQIFSQTAVKSREDQEFLGFAVSRSRRQPPRIRGMPFAYTEVVVQECRSLIPCTSVEHKMPGLSIGERRTKSTMQMNESRIQVESGQDRHIDANGKPCEMYHENILHDIRAFMSACVKKCMDLINHTIAFTKSIKLLQCVKAQTCAELKFPDPCPSLCIHVAHIN
ncbi:hypothetical protein WN51_13715, partial [Melipona quadrifasciata]